jgi:hypothetical protein
VAHNWGLDLTFLLSSASPTDISILKCCPDFVETEQASVECAHDLKNLVPTGTGRLYSRCIRVTKLILGTGIPGP